MDYTDTWTMESALEVLQHPTVDSKIWAEAVEWLLLNGPPGLRQALERAAGHATRECFPQLKPEGYGPDGQPCYTLTDLAKALNTSVEEVASTLETKQEQHGTAHLLSKNEVNKIQ